PGIADLYEWVVTLDARRLASVPALAAPCPLPSMRRCRFDASCDDSIELNASNHSGASKRGEPRREGRLWRSRRKSGSRGEESLGRRRSRAGYPLADTVCATRRPEAQRRTPLENDNELPAANRRHYLELIPRADPRVRLAA